MKRLGKYLKYRNLIFVIILSLITAWPLVVPGYFTHHDDLQVIRIYEMRKCFSDWQIPCRWVPDMGFGYGFPMFNYYAPLAYYLGAIASFGLGFIGSAKFVFFIPIIIGAWGMYLITKKMFGNPGGIFGAVLFTYAPYRALDLYVRGAISESLAISIIPFIFYFSWQLREKKTLWNFIGLTASSFFFLISHNLMLLIFPLFLAGWELTLIALKGWKKSASGFKAYLLSLGLSAFFVLPAFFERNLINTEGLISYELDFRANFISIAQLIRRDWGYVLQNPALDNSMSFQIGWPHLAVILLSLVIIVINQLRKRESVSKKKLLLLYFLASLGISAFMTHIRSAFIWEEIDILRYVQFPWRFLSVVVVYTSFIGAYFIFVINRVYSKYLVLILVLITVVLNFSYFKPEMFYSTNDMKKLSGEEFSQQKKGALLDYLPEKATPPTKEAPNLPYFDGVEGKIYEYSNTSNYWSFRAEIDDTSTIVVPIFAFPNWRVWINGGEYFYEVEPKTGLIRLKLNPGNYQIIGKFMNTPLRNIANLITLASFLGLVFMAYYEKIHKKSLV